MVTPYLPPRLGGREFWVMWMARELAARGIEVAVFAANVSDYHRRRMRFDRYVEEGVHICKVPVIYDIDAYSTPIVFPPLLLWELWKWKPDVVHIHEPNLFLTTPAAVFTKKILRKKLVTHCYGDPFDWYKQGVVFRMAVWLYGFLYSLKLKLSDRVIAISREYLDRSRYLPRYLDKVDILPMCVAPAFRPLPAHEVAAFKAERGMDAGRIVLYAGRLDHRKGVDVLIRAMSEVDARCIIVGAGEKSTTAVLESLVAELHLGDRVQFAGRVGQDDLNRYYNACDVLVLPTSDVSAETFGAVLIEAWAAGKPVISADNPAPARLIRESGGGLLARREDPQDLAKAIRAVLADAALAQRLAQAGKQYVESRFSYRAVAGDLVRLYEQVVAASP